MARSDRSTLQMTLVDHLSDLRRRIIYTLVVFIAAIIVAFVFVQHIYAFLIRPLLGEHLTVLGPTEVIRVYLMIAFLAALVPTLPFALFQLWLFVSPGLTVRERRITLRFIPAIVFMFIGGVSFGYFVIFPMLFRFLKNLASSEFIMMFTAANYFGFMTNLVIPFGLLFEMPLVVMFLTRLGILNPMRLSKMRRYAYLVLVIIGSMLSPPELISHLSVTVPMILLYEISILISRVVYRKRLRERAVLEAVELGEAQIENEDADVDTDSSVSVGETRRTERISDDETTAGENSEPTWEEHTYVPEVMPTHKDTGVEHREFDDREEGDDPKDSREPKMSEQTGEETGNQTRDAKEQDDADDQQKRPGKSKSYMVELDPDDRLF